MIKENFKERLKRMIYSCSVKHEDFWFIVSFTSKEEADKYRAMYPNREIFLFASLLYDKAEDAIAPQKLKVVINSEGYL